MSEHSAISWTDSTWNCVLGCSKVSEGCRSCYAILQAWMKQSNPNAKIRAAYEGLVHKLPDGSLNWTGRVNAIPERLEIPLHWKKGRRIFVNSLSDLFHQDVPDEFIDRVFAVMALTPRHTYQILTKRPERMADYVLRLRGQLERLIAASRTFGYGLEFERSRLFEWPLPNVWLGTSTEDQKTADERIPHLLRTPASVRFLSCEPLIGAVDLHPWMGHWAGVDFVDGEPILVPNGRAIPRRIAIPKLHWVVAGGESGSNARPMHPAWARSLRDQCKTAGVPFFFKQHGEWQGVDQSDAMVPANMREHLWPDGTIAFRVGNHAAGDLLDGVAHHAFPETAGVSA